MLIRDAGGGGSVEAPSIETDDFSDVPLPAEPATAIAGRARRLALGTCCTAVAAVVVVGASGHGPLGGGRAAAVPLALPPAERALPAVVLEETWDDLAVDLTEEGSGAGDGDDDLLVEYPETGCGNWRKLAIIEAITVVDPHSCAQACLNEPGCVRANFQHRQPGVDGCTAKWSTTVHSCYLFGTSAECDCIKSYNPCWLLLEPRPDTLKPSVYSLSEIGTGCKNWRNATIGEVIHDLWNHHMCAKECEYTEGCVMFNFQQRECPANKTDCGDQAGFGRCVLLNHSCHQESNQYWDLYTMSA